MKDGVYNLWIVYDIYKSEILNNNSINVRRGEMELYFCMFFFLYVKWINVIWK